VRVPEAVIQEINKRASIVETVSEYLTLERKGGRFWGLCPFHGEKTPSFSVTEDENLFYCFGCHKGGSIFSFIMEMEGISFLEAVRKLAEKTGVSLPESDDSQPIDQQVNSLKELYSKLAKTFSFFLTGKSEGSRALAYLKERGLTLETIETFNLGYAPADRGWLYRFLRGKNYSAEFLAESGLFSSKYPEICLFSDRLMFPICNRRGEAVAFGGRKLGEGEPKYINSPETSLYKKRDILYGLSKVLPVIRKQRKVYLVEGYFDVLAFYQSGAGGAIAPLGTAFTREQAALIKRYVNEAFLVFDGDKAGIEAAKKSIPVMEEAGLESSVVELPGASDPADILQKGAPDSLIKALKYSINSFEYLVKHALKNPESSKPGGEREVLAAVAPYLHVIESDVKREGCIRYLSDALSIDPASIVADLKKIGSGGHVLGAKSVKEGNSPSETEKAEPIHINQELYLLLAVAANRSFWEKVRSVIALEDIENRYARALYIALEESFRSGEMELDLVLHRLESEKLKALIYEKLSGKEFSTHGESIIQDGIRALRQRKLETRRREIETEIRRAEREGFSHGQIRELVTDKIYLDQELKKGKGE
jgi:DNA primase